MVPVVDRLIRSNPDLRVVYRVIPAFGQISVFTDSAIMAAKFQGAKRYQQFRALVVNQVVAPNPHSVLALAEQAGLNVQQLLSDMHRPEIMQTLKDNLEAFYVTKQSQIPVIMIGALNQQAPTLVTIGEQPYSRFQSAIDHIKEVNHGK